MPTFPPLRHAAALALVIGLAACGGGDPDAADATADTDADAAISHAASEEADTPAAAPDSTDARALALQPAITSSCGLANFDAEALQRVNAYRARGASCGARGSFAATFPLAWSGSLNSAAARHSKDMVARNFFSHTGSDGSNPGTRISQTGYVWRGWGENIAAGQRSVQSVVDGWMASPGHCANIMNPKLRDIGLACVRGTSGNSYGTYWTMDLAVR